MSFRVRLGAIAVVLLPIAASGQSTKLKVVSSDSMPIPYAWVVMADHGDRVTDAEGELDLGSARHKRIAFQIRRIGYQPWVGTLTTPERAGVLTVTLLRSAQSHARASADSAAPKKSELELTGFYDRWLRKMQGMSVGATFIGPEMIALRNPTNTTDMLEHVFGVTLVRNSKGARIATGSAQLPMDEYLRSMNLQLDRFGHECYLSVVVDDEPLCPPIGCHHVFADNPRGSTRDEHTVDLDKLVDAKRLIGMEVYPSKEAMPEEVQYESDGCGVILVWTRRGTRN